MDRRVELWTGGVMGLMEGGWRGSEVLTVGFPARHQEFPAVRVFAVESSLPFIILL